MTELSHYHPLGLGSLFMRLSPKEWLGFLIRIAAFLNSIPTPPAAPSSRVLRLGLQPVLVLLLLRLRGFCGVLAPMVLFASFWFQTVGFLTFICARFSLCSYRRSYIRLSLTSGSLCPIVYHRRRHYAVQVFTALGIVRWLDGSGRQAGCI
jgi:hypothetical protein